MGVPSYFKWLSQRYRNVIVDAKEELPTTCDGDLVYPDQLLPNPNEIEYDCLYLDMNGIIHPCAHPENRAPPTNDDEIIVEIFHYIDRVFNIVRPRRLIYLSIDGVA